jgi:FKBP-type peptidyl-prolyl cis-trans isomerase FkpA
MKKVFYLLAFSSVAITGCKNGFKKTTEGMEYKIISDDKGAKLQEGNFMEIAFKVEYKDASMDTILVDSKDVGNQVAPFSSQIPAPYYNIFKQLRVGDSVILRQLTDTLIKSGRSLPFMKKDQYSVTTFKLVNIFTEKAQSDSAMKVNMKIAKAKRYQMAVAEITKQLATTEADQMKVDDKMLTDYMTKNNIVATKTAWGDYVSITTPGTGENLDNTSIAVVNYTGKTLNDTTFDSNTDPKFNHTDPLQIDMSEFRMIPGWLDGLKLFKKGSKGILLIPSSLAYGKSGQGGKIKPNENLVFNIEIVDVLTAEQFEADKAAKQQKMMDQRKHMMDSIQNARRDTLKK